VDHNSANFAGKLRYNRSMGLAVRTVVACAATTVIRRQEMRRLSYRIVGTALVVAAAGWASAAQARCDDGRDRHVQLINETSVTLRELYGSNSGRDAWEEDVLGADVLPPGGTVRVNWDDGSCACLFDFKAVFADGGETIRRRFNVCRESVWRIRN
jgi:hypothetical protein